MSTTAEELFREYRGEFVPRYFHGGYVALSFVVSLIGTLSTLELINRRTSRKGLFNHVLLFGASVSMGGVAIWCMHFVGTRAIILANGERTLQISYNPGFTVLSFFMPIVVLLIAFIAVGIGENSTRHRLTRVALGGLVAGVAVCGMHYLGNASISNYICVYDPAYIAGSAIIAVAASTLALCIFFVYRHAWVNSWWKTLVSGLVLAGAVSGMHWCAASGTRYRLRGVDDAGGGVSMNDTVIVVIVLSIIACLSMAGTAFYKARARMKTAKKAQQVVLAAAVFHPSGRILVNRSGLLPSEGITDTFLDKDSKEKFDTNHPLFHWMFRASRNWSAIQPLLNGMGAHLSRLPRQGRDRDARANINLVSEHGEIMEKYDVVFRELFCVAAGALASRMKESLSDVGALWEEILTTGSGGSDESGDVDSKLDARVQVRDLEKGSVKKDKTGKGSLMFLVRRVESEHDVDRLGAAGYRFVDIHQVAASIAASMQIKCDDIEATFREMAKSTEKQVGLAPGVHVGFFGIRQKGQGLSYDILVRKEAKILLPSVRLPLEKLSTWHLEFLQRFEGVTIGEIERRVDSWKDLSKKEAAVARHLVDAVLDLRAWVGDAVVENAALTSRVFKVPCTNESGSAGYATATVIAFRTVIPTGAKVVSANCIFIPLSLFKVHQLTAPASPHHLAFSRDVHRELAPIINATPKRKADDTSSRSNLVPMGGLPARIRRFGRKREERVDGDGNPIPTVFGGDGHHTPSASIQSTSTLKLWDRNSVEQVSNESPFEAPAPAAANLSMLGGIMISEEVTINVHDNGGGSSRGSSHDSDGDSVPRRHSDEPVGESIEMSNLHGSTTMRMANIEVERYNELVTFVDELYALSVVAK